MLSLVTGMRTEPGFSLIEILVVLLIMSIVLSFGLLAFGDFGASRNASIQAEELLAYIKVLQYQALLENKAFAIRVNPKGYLSFRFEGGAWQPMPSKGIFHPRRFPANIVVSLKQNAKEPGIIIDAAGTVKPFAIDLGTKQQLTLVKLLGEANGSLLIQRQS